MGLAKEELLRRKNDEHVQFIADNICNQEGEKPYVFVSYKSDDWEVVLHDIVYTLVKNYGLNVYFDGDFDGHNPLWTKQFPVNMESSLCKGVLTFIDNKYATSYATLLELMYSQAGCQDDDYKYINKKVVPIYLEKLKKNSEIIDTGLGKTVFEDGTTNDHAEDEKKLFDKTFQSAWDNFKIFKKTEKPYMDENRRSKEPLLPRKLCSVMVRELIEFIGANDNYYQGINSLDGIVKSIRDACGSDVFSGIGGGEPKPPIPTAPTWRYRAKNASAALIWDGESKSCTVLAGSRVGTEAAGFANLESAKKLKDSLIDQKILVDGAFTRDYECNKVSTMINVLNGGSVSMPAEIKNGHLAPMNEAFVPGHGTEHMTSSPVTVDDSVSNPPVNGTGLQIALDEFVNKYDDKHFTVKSFDRMELQVEENSDYSIGQQSSTRDIVWQFMMKLLKDRGEKIIHLMNQKIGGVNPVFVRSEQMKQYKVTYKETDVDSNWAMCTNYSQYGWLVRLKMWSEIAGFDSRRIKLKFYDFHPND